ncbi:MAG: archaemetzincin family Zn-dependent metalloprotease [Methanobacteriota archaeon]
MIEMVPFGEVDAKLLQDICKEVEIVFGECAISGKKLQVPKENFDEKRKQYESKYFLEVLARHAKNSNAEKILGITDEDLFTPGLNFIFGQAYVSGRICIISTHRLNPRFYGARENEILLLGRCAKEAIHELGHCFGLEHCSDRRCVMVFSNSIIDVDRKTKKFCEKCRI